jgi:hypothetical protein
VTPAEFLSFLSAPVSDRGAPALPPGTDVDRLSHEGMSKHGIPVKVNGLYLSFVERQALYDASRF